MAQLQTECVFQALMEHTNQTLVSYTNAPDATLDDILSVPVVNQTLVANTGQKAGLMLVR